MSHPIFNLAKRWPILVSAAASLVLITGGIAAHNSSAPNDTALLFDYRQLNPSLNSFNQQHSAAIIAAAMGSGAVRQYELSSQANGYFTDDKTSQTLYLITAKSAPPEKHAPPRTLLFVFEQGRVKTQFVLADGNFSHIDSVFDSNQDGLDEVLLREDFVHMGIVSYRAAVYAFGDGKSRRLADLGQVFQDTCQASIGEQSVFATLLSQQEGALARTDLVTPCQQ